MGVYINIEMPKSCGNCFYDRQCDIWRRRNWGMPPPDDCPLVPVPPHGDLIDRKLLIKSENLHYEIFSAEWYVTVRDIELAPTIIPASED